VKQNFTDDKMKIKKGPKSGQEGGEKFNVEVQKIIEIRRNIKTKTTKTKQQKNEG